MADKCHAPKDKQPQMPDIEYHSRRYHTNVRYQYLYRIRQNACRSFEL